MRMDGWSATPVPYTLVTWAEARRGMGARSYIVDRLAGSEQMHSGLQQVIDSSSSSDDSPASFIV
jgi:hypothetical protein